MSSHNNLKDTSIENDQSLKVISMLTDNEVDNQEEQAANSQSVR